MGHLRVGGRLRPQPSAGWDHPGGLSLFPFSPEGCAALPSVWASPWPPGTCSPHPTLALLLTQPPIPPRPRDHSHPPAGTTLASPSPSSALHPASLLCWTAGLTLSGCGPRPKTAVPLNLPVGPSSDRERVRVTHIRHECEGKMGHRTAQEQARGLWSDCGLHH